MRDWTSSDTLPLVSFDTDGAYTSAAFAGLTELRRLVCDVCGAPGSILWLPPDSDEPDDAAQPARASQAWCLPCCPHLPYSARTRRQMRSGGLWFSYLPRLGIVSRRILEC